MRPATNPHCPRSVGHFAYSPVSSRGAGAAAAFPSFGTGNSRCVPAWRGAGGRTGRYHRGDGGGVERRPAPRPAGAALAAYPEAAAGPRHGGDGAEAAHGRVQA